MKTTTFAVWCIKQLIVNAFLLWVALSTVFAVPCFGLYIIEKHWALLLMPITGLIVYCIGIYFWITDLYNDYKSNNL